MPRGAAGRCACAHHVDDALPHAGELVPHVLRHLVRREIAREGVGDARDGLFEQVVDQAALEADPAGEGLVLAVLAPGLRDRLQFDARGLAAKAVVVRLHGAHLAEVQGQAAFLAECRERIVG